MLQTTWPQSPSGEAHCCSADWEFRSYGIRNFSPSTSAKTSEDSWCKPLQSKKLSTTYSRKHFKLRQSSITNLEAAEGFPVHAKAFRTAKRRRNTTHFMFYRFFLTFIIDIIIIIIMSLSGFHGLSLQHSSSNVILALSLLPRPYSFLLSSSSPHYFASLFLHHFYTFIFPLILLQHVTRPANNH